SININLPWFDLMEVFKNPEHPIIIKNCFSFSLKEIVKNMHNHNMIKTVWAELDDALLSAFIARDIYEHNTKTKTKSKDNTNTNTNTNTNMQEIIEYNFIDCKVLQEILSYIRKS
ncbi:MAG: DnaQ-like or DEDD 3'-5' exonuclease, partial [Gaeavirus sp.]